MNIVQRCSKIKELFEHLMLTDSRIDKEYYVDSFKFDYNMLADDLNFCFEILAGKHKLGYKPYELPSEMIIPGCNSSYNMTIKELYQYLQTFSAKQSDILIASKVIPPEIRDFFVKLCNREYKLGYSNKDAMIADTSPMLAKKFPEDFREEGVYYIQEKLDGNRCIAYHDGEKWCFKTRSGKPMKVDFDLSDFDTSLILDGEVMTIGKAGSRDFNNTSGVINSKYLDKSQLHYYIYDVIDESLTYDERREILNEYVPIEATSETQKDWTILHCLDQLTFISHYGDKSFDKELEALDVWLDYIVDKGGEGLILRKASGTYHCGKRTDDLLKYKKIQTMDLRITGWNAGQGKYEGAIGSFVCEDDEGTIEVDVAGISDDIRWSNPDDYIGRIIEVGYFDISQSKINDKKSLRFPRFKCFRDDKNTTSIY